METSYSFLLVHGSWHEGSAWDDVVHHLEEAGHRAYAPTVAGHGPGVNKDVTHADCVDSIVEYVEREDLSDFVLVGHSFGGTVIAKVAERMPDRISRLVFQNAFVPEDGSSLADEIPPHIQELFETLAAQSDDNTIMLPYEIWRDGFIGDSDESLARETYEYLSPEPYAPLVASLDLSTFYGLEIPSSYLYCTEDVALPPGPEWGWHPRMSNRLGVYRLVTMPGSHETMFTDPSGLAESILKAGRE
ncbi:alpha/beta fold hydrolase [Halobellus captivus]|uniref:alpha/beta fold hydrolase n=1 Tax=Halobellus captivus TaxID=2592614 RepID=UPI0011A6830D|nr:alpha/beta hydrolase [Halobellus captivus]